MAIIWETVGRLGRRVTMSEAAWNHIVDGHDEILVLPEDIRNAVKNADAVRRDRKFDRRAIHYRYIGRGMLWLRVVVNYRPDERLGWAGEVVTAYLTRSQYKEEAQLWP